MFPSATMERAARHILETESIGSVEGAVIGVRPVEVSQAGIYERTSGREGESERLLIVSNFIG